MEANIAMPAGVEARRIASPLDGKWLHLIRRSRRKAMASPVLYVHGATFPASLAIGWRFDGRSWMDDLHDAGFDVWGFDFLGYGGSDRYDEMREPPVAGKPLGRTAAACDQLAAVVHRVLEDTGAARVHLVAHSWGTQPAAMFAAQAPELVDRLVLFGPILRRAPDGAALPDPAQMPSHAWITVDAQWRRFTEDVPVGHAPVLSARHFARWSEAYLDSDSGSRDRTPPAVCTPLGPAADIAAAWRGDLPYDPAAVRSPTLLVRGAWDSLCNDGDAAWFADNFRNAADRRERKIARGTHLMHLEESRFALWEATRDFLGRAA